VNKQRENDQRRLRRRFHVRNRVRGTAERPRLSVHRSLHHISCQLIDDASGATLVSASSKDKELRDQLKTGGNKQAAAAIGKVLAGKALAAGIREARFDRGHCKYHGRLAALADAAREAGLSF
jgi:large subunit ribosomal protein L18